MRVAVIGTGIAGSAAAWSLSKRYPVTIYEREFRPGGHSHTVAIDYDGTRLAVDVGFIVYNELNYPELTALFRQLDIETEESSMSFAVTADAGRFEWKGCGGNWLDTLEGLFVQPKNLVSPSYLWMLRDVSRFNIECVEDYETGRLAGLTLGDYLASRNFAPRLLVDYLAPMGAAIWSMPATRIRDFPAENFVAFFSSHRLLQYDRPVWRTVKGGSRRYVEKLTSAFRDQLRLGCAVTSIKRTPRGVVVHDSHGRSDVYDHVVIASHSDQALAMLSDADDRERAVLGAIGYAPNAVYLHRDVRLMPKRRRAWASWNFLRWQRESACENDVAVTYWMNRLQDIDDDKPLFVSLNPPFAPDPALTFGKYMCDHPQYNAAAFAAQKRLSNIQGRRHTWFCGAWTGYGFHEDGLRSGLADKVEIRLQDYRDERDQYNRIASIEMIEAVGEQFWPNYFSQLRDRLLPGGLAGIQAITIQDSLFQTYCREVDFIQRYVFPGGMLPSPQVLKSLGERFGIPVIRERIFGQDYAKTLAIWRSNFRAAWPHLSIRFRRPVPAGCGNTTWLIAKAGFLSGNIDVRQVVFAKSK